MILGPVAQIIAFTVLSLIAVLGALGMATTMSMYRSGIFLMASFIGVSGLFILLSADLLGLLQVMMYIGGMLVMVLFMVLFSHDPGGNMMAGMRLPLVEKFFSLGLLPKDEEKVDTAQTVALLDRSESESSSRGEHHHEDHAGHDHAARGGHKGHEHGNHEEDSHEWHEEGENGGHDHGEMSHSDMDHGDMDMSMVTPVRPWAAALGIATGAVLVLLLLVRPAWPVVDAVPDPDSARRVGDLLMSKYMMAFEGAGLLILVGIFGAVFIARPDRHPSPKARDNYVGRDVTPPELEDDTLAPFEPSAASEQDAHEHHAHHEDHA